MSLQTIGTHFTSITEIENILHSNIQLSDEAIQNISYCRNYLDEKLKNNTDLIYGINTGFGSLCNIRISDSEIEKLQENLVLSHACGTGKEVPIPIAKLMLLLKIKNFTYGKSGVSTALVERLTYMYNNDIIPVVYDTGSLGASGDLAPLAHLSLPLLNKGFVYYNGEKIASSKLNLPPLSLRSKEGLALLNGTQFMNSYLIHCIIKAQKLLQWANYVAALSLDAFYCKLDPFYAPIHQIRNHKGQQWVAAQILEILKGSQLAQKEKLQVQDPYSFRCIPQVHGATYDAIQHISTIAENEMNAVTDNPLIFPNENKIISGGNFHGQTLAIHADFLSIAVAELASIAERRMYLLISGQRDLPPFLVNSAGLDSGLMIAQYTAAALVSKNKQLCTPASVDSIVSSNGQEDHVSMGANAVTQLYQVIQNTETVLAIEWLCATQAMYCRHKASTSPILHQIMNEYRKEVSPILNDRLLYDDIQKSIYFIQNYAIPLWRK